MRFNILENKKGDIGSKNPNVPEKFLDENGEIKVNELIEDYNKLACKLGNCNLPKSYEEYQINIPHPSLEQDQELHKQFLEKGFTNEQAQFVYDLAGERVIPLLDKMSLDYESDKQKEKLMSHFGSEDKFSEVSRQVSTWAKQNLNPEIYDVLSTSYEGVMALYNMMSSSEPVMGRGVSSMGDLSEDKLRQMMQDPKYWRDKDPQYIQQISDGFKRLYPDNK
jgi:hypothetical protein